MSDFCLPEMASGAPGLTRPSFYLCAHSNRLVTERPERRAEGRRLGSRQMLWG